MTKPARQYFILYLTGVFVLTYFLLLANTGVVHAFGFPLPVPDLNPKHPKVVTALPLDRLNLAALANLEAERDEIIAARRRVQINKVKRFFQAYGSPLQGYEDEFVDISEQCGGDYRMLVAIAGSESGLGRHPLLKYNPFGYLNRVQYKNQRQAIRVLGCRISQQHIAVCKTDLDCLAIRYAGPKDNLERFKYKIKWFFEQVD